MKILFDQGTPAPLRKVLPGHDIKTAFENGWAKLENGALLAAAETAGFDVLVTTDQSLSYQQNLSARRLAVVVLLTTNWPRIRPQAQRIADAISALKPGDYVELNFSNP